MEGEKNKQRQNYLSLTKEYIFSVLVGISTDTHDIFVLTINRKNQFVVSDNQVNQFTNSKLGINIQLFPVYSSKTVQGKHLFWWAKQYLLNKIEIPSHQIEIFTFEYVKRSQTTSAELQNLITARINGAKGDFRQQLILSNWQTFFHNKPNFTYPILHVKIACLSGTYIRSIAHELGLFLHIPSLTLDLYLTKVGQITLAECINLLPDDSFSITK